jgi:hypothetical protein
MKRRDGGSLSQSFCSWPMRKRRLRTYGELRNRLKPTKFVPVHNEAVSVPFAAADFPASRVKCGAIHVAGLRRWSAV